MKNWLSYSVACAALMLSACGAEDYFNTENGAAYREKYTQDVKNEFRANFEEKFGTISPTQTWDFVDNEYNYPGTRGTTENNPTVTTGDYLEIESATLTWMKNKLTEGKDHRNLGKPFTLSMPKNSFTIVPIYQGEAGLDWELHMVAGTGPDAKDIKIWEKSQGIQYKSRTSDSSWKNLSSSGNTINAAAVRSLQYTIDNVPNGTDIYFYLLITDNSWNTRYASIGKHQSSLVGQMLALTDCPAPSNLPKYQEGTTEVMILGCEDSDNDRYVGTLKHSSDWDMNDVVFLIYGNPNRPKPVVIEDDESWIPREITKRYMIEDLGATDDFDYNDVVVDVTTLYEEYHKYTFVNGEMTKNETDPSKDRSSTSAIIRALGGTLDFDLKIGNDVGTETVTWNKRKETNNPYAMWNTGTPTSAKDEKGHVIYDGTNIDWNAEGYVITGIEGWTPDNNAISIDVFQNRMSDAASTSINAWSMRTEFPAPGATPFIIAVPVTQKWAVERKTFTDLNNYLNNK